MKTQTPSDGFQRLAKFLTWNWYRSKLKPHVHDDCTQVVYMTLLESLGRYQFEEFVQQFRSAAMHVKRQQNDPGYVCLARAINKVTKRCQREEQLWRLGFWYSLNNRHDTHFAEGDILDPRSVARPDPRLEALRDVVDNGLSTADADLVRSLMVGDTAHDIAKRRGSPYKTASNARTKVLKKLRGMLVNG